MTRANAATATKRMRFRRLIQLGIVYRQRGSAANANGRSERQRSRSSAKSRRADTGVWVQDRARVRESREDRLESSVRWGLGLVNEHACTSGPRFRVDLRG